MDFTFLFFSHSTLLFDSTRYKKSLQVVTHIQDHLHSIQKQSHFDSMMQLQYALVLQFSWVVVVTVGSICFNYLLSPYSFFRVLVDPYSLPRTCFETTVLELNVDPATGSISLVTLKKEGTGGGVRVCVCVYAFKKIIKAMHGLAQQCSRYMAWQ